MSVFSNPILQSRAAKTSCFSSSSTSQRPSKYHGMEISSSTATSEKIDWQAATIGPRLPGAYYIANFLTPAEASTLTDDVSMHLT